MDVNKFEVMGLIFIILIVMMET